MKFLLVTFVVGALLFYVARATGDVALPQILLSDVIQSLALPVENHPLREERELSTLAHRNLLQVQLRYCLWNPRSFECEIGGAYLESLANEGESGCAELLRRQYSCIRNGQTEETCSALSDCGWLPEGLCFFVDYPGVYPSSPCVKNVPLTLLSGKLLYRCPLRNSASACSNLSGCSWNEFWESCFADTNQVFFGIGQVQFETERVEVDRTKTAAIKTTILSNESFVSMDSYWNLFLDWQVPSTECPAGNDQLVCDYVDAYFDVLVPTYLYCSTKFTETSMTPEDCNADPLCSYRTRSGVCGQALALTLAAFEAADNQVLLPLVPKPNDREIIKHALICNRKPTESECTGVCQWLPSIGRCRQHPLHEAELYFSGVQNPSDDAVCSNFIALVENQCLGASSITACNARTTCQWYSESNFCTTLPSTGAKTLLEQDPELRESYERFVQTCSMYKTLEKCTAATTSPMRSQ